MNKQSSKSTTLIAEIVGCSTSMVSRVLNEKRNTDTALSKKIIYTARILAENEAKQQEKEQEIRRKIKQDISSI